jgi:ribosomal protein L13E
LSSPSKKKRVSGKKKEEEPKRIVKEKVSKPAGTPPSAIVEARHNGLMMQRRARGYSLGEITQAGLNVGLARRWGLPVDDMRRSALEGNVTSLKKWSSRPKKTTEEKVEGEVQKIERAVEKEVHKAKKEVEKAKKEVEKVEKEVVEKVEAPAKKRSKKKAAPKSKSP